MLTADKLKEFYNNKKILVTGHTGFKGTWLCKILTELNCNVSGYSLESPTIPSLYELIQMKEKTHSYFADVRNFPLLSKVFSEVRPEIVIHMAAQPLVRESYKEPLTTYETNVMGTVNVLECIRNTSSVKSFVNVTTDKVYRNNEWDKGYVETDYLDGYDPYSNSKSCSELITHSYAQSFLTQQGIAVSTCRAGNVIGGGDFAADRIIPDCVRAAVSGQNIIVRNPHSIRPYQHILEPLFAYLMVAMKQYENLELAGSYNVGPEDTSCITTGELVKLFCTEWKKLIPDSKLKWIDQFDGGPHEANFLKLDCTKLKNTFDWKPKWSVEEAIQRTIEFEAIRYKHCTEIMPQDMSEELQNCMYQQIRQYLK